jgi:hypothetical protein
MKAEFRHVQIEVGQHASGNVSDAKVNVYRFPRGSSRGHRAYPFTERNYWRAVGMQIVLAGFASSVPSIARECTHAENHEMYFGNGANYCPHCGTRIAAGWVRVDDTKEML